MSEKPGQLLEGKQKQKQKQKQKEKRNLPKKIFLRECRGEHGAPESALTISSSTLGDITSSMICSGQTAARRLLFSAKESKISNSNSQHFVKSAFGHFCIV